MTTIVTDGKSQEWQNWEDDVSHQSGRVKGQVHIKDLLGDKSPDYSGYLGKQSKGTALDWDRYDLDEFLYLLKGRMKVEDYDEGRTYIAEPGDFTYIKRGSKVKQTFEEDSETFAVLVPKYDPSMERRD